MNILILGQGGREHALAWKVRQSPLCEHLVIAPGNAGTSIVGECVDIKADNIEGLIQFAKEKRIDLVIVGPEAPLAAGLVDYLIRARPDLLVIGPTQSGARLEASKAFSKAFMQKYNIPTAGYNVINKDDLQRGIAVIDQMATPIVLKADGLAAGKGVIICQTQAEAKTVLEDMLTGQFGQASETVVIEEFLRGREYSVFILTNGNSYYLLPVAKDYKRVGEGDNGPNTGGMGAVSPVSYVDERLMQKTVERIIDPTISGLKSEGISYSGFIFFGLIEVGGDPLVIEYNCRMGDPETEAVMPRIESDLVQHFIDVSAGHIDPKDLVISESACSTVMLVSGGYPGSYEKGKIISGSDEVRDCLLFHAGTRREANDLVTNGGRVLAVSAMAEKAEEAIAKCYEEIPHITFEKQYFRSDIGFDL